MRLIHSAVLLLLCSMLAGRAQAAQPLRIALLEYGTVSWEINVIKHHKLDEKENVRLEIIPLASTQATKVALQAGSADIIVTDWLWVSRQRGQGADFTLVPYSSALGAVMVAPASGIKRLVDLKGKKVGVAGGPLDKSWLMLRAYARKIAGFDPQDQVELVFGAPPLLAEKLAQGELDAVLNYWHFCARLEARGFKRLIGMNDVVRGLGGTGELAMIGYTFKQSWASENRQAVKGFIRAAKAARQILASSDAEWERLAPLTKAKDAETLRLLRERYREGIPKDTAASARDAGIVFGVLAELGGPKLVGDQTKLAPGTFWEVGSE